VAASRFFLEPLYTAKERKRGVLVFMCHPV